MPFTHRLKIITIIIIIIIAIIIIVITIPIIIIIRASSQGVAGGALLALRSGCADSDVLAVFPGYSSWLEGVVLSALGLRRNACLPYSPATQPSWQVWHLRHS